MEYTGAIGVPMPSTEVVLRDDAGKDMALGQPGEICIRGPQVMKGYWQRPDETAKVLGADGFLHTGDIGIMDEKGFIRIVDRKKDMILVSGFNVYPNEIEQVVAMHPGVLECAAIGVPDEHSGEVPKVYRGEEGPRAHRAGRARALQEGAHRLQAAEVRRVPLRSSQDQRGQDPAPRAARGKKGGVNTGDRHWCLAPVPVTGRF